MIDSISAGEGYFAGRFASRKRAPVSSFSMNLPFFWT
jgi:hypothetical protein